MARSWQEADRIEVRRDAQALLSGGFTVHQALALVHLREAWKPRLMLECFAQRRAHGPLAFARWLYRQHVLQS